MYLFSEYGCKNKTSLYEKVTLEALNVSIDDNYHKIHTEKIKIQYFCSNHSLFGAICLD